MIKTITILRSKNKCHNPARPNFDPEASTLLQAFYFSEIVAAYCKRLEKGFYSNGEKGFFDDFGLAIQFINDNDLLIEMVLRYTEETYDPVIINKDIFFKASAEFDEIRKEFYRSMKISYNGNKVWFDVIKYTDEELNFSGPQIQGDNIVKEKNVIISVQVVIFMENA